MKRTPWYPATIDPVRRGLYEVRCTKGTTWGRYTKVRWTGEHWKYGIFAPANVLPCDEWRGLAEKPK